MSFCKYCGRKIEYDAVYCSGCGKKLEVSNNKTQRETVFEGNLHKCPNCGEIVNSFLANCTSCGHEFRETKVVSSVELLSRELKDIDAKSLQSGDKNTIFSDKFSLSTTDKAKIDLIKNFPIPNTKEDIIEFIILANSNINIENAAGYGTNGFDIELSKAWLHKLEQADRKAELLFGKSQEYIDIRNLYEKKLDEIEQYKRQDNKIGIIVLIVLVLVWIVLIIITNN